MTVATVDYIPQAIVTLRSVRRHNPECLCYLFAINAAAGAVSELSGILRERDSWIRIFGPNDLTIGRERFLDAFQRYNAMELACLAKYVGLRHVMQDESAGEICLFIDGDMLVFSDLRKAITELRDYAVLLTPHLTRPADDATEHDILLHGWMNAGFLGFRRTHPKTPAIMEWLVDRITRRGYFAPHYGLSCDQKWVSALPVLFKDVTFISGYPGLNVGYWNLTERPLTKDGSVMSAGNVPLATFHFSGFDWENSRRLSKHSRDRVFPESPLEALCMFYQSELESVRSMREPLSQVATLSCATGDLTERLQKAAVGSGLNIAAPTTYMGIFSRLGLKIDSLVRRKATS